MPSKATSDCSILDTIGRISEIAAILCCAVITIDIILQVFFRYVLNNSLQWSEELGVYVMIWMVFLGSSLLMRNSEHIRIIAIIRLLPWWLKVSLNIISRLVGLGFLVFVAYYGVKVFFSGTSANSPSLGISTKWIKLAIPSGAILMTIDSFRLLAKDIKDLLHGNRTQFIEREFS
jgi:TRAP-type C4-dicarboxylate transport system permease small subunit